MVEYSLTESMAQYEREQARQNLSAISKQLRYIIMDYNNSLNMDCSAELCRSYRNKIKDIIKILNENGIEI